MTDTTEIVEQNKSLKDQLATLSSASAKNVGRLSDMIDHRNAALRRIVEVLQPAASNRRLMQIANPARQCINIAKRYIEDEED